MRCSHMAPFVVDRRARTLPAAPRMITEIMSSFFKKTFGWLGGGEQPADTPSGKHDPETYKGCTITPSPKKEGSQWRLSGTISKEVDGEMRERSFVRADLFGSETEAARFAVDKAKLIIDQNPALFSGDKTGTA